MTRRSQIVTFFIIIGLVATAWFVTRARATERVSEDGIEPNQARTDEMKPQPNYGAIPHHFESNAGQVDDQVKFLSRGSGYSLFLTSDEAVLALQNPSIKGDEGSTTAFLRMKIVGANSSPKIEGENLLEGKTNYIVGSDSSKWKTGIDNFERVRYSNIYDGVDVVYYGSGKQLEYDFVVAPNVSPDQIVLEFEGSKSIEVAENGYLILQFEDGEMRQHKPIAYQEVNGKRIEIASQYSISNFKSQI